ncbi:uncharacterized protein LOC115875864 [Sitophilus oryzae]|uniref:Uncharacterized protein LOC115875864 n=1 Tax=Sitophilus oryzae TaxID=7048 RepID=A0A6J2X7V3_SITOR|nr:uncharacterized protein LOC115875864 [Sitophilus oryzae]
MGTKAIEGDAAVPELGFGKVEIPNKTVLKTMSNTAPMIPPIIEVSEIASESDVPYIHDYARKVEIPNTSHGPCSEDLVPSTSIGLKRKMEQQGSNKSGPIRRRPNATFRLSNELRNLNQQSVQILQDIYQSMESVSNSLQKISSNTENIANSIKEIADIVTNAFPNK